MNTLNPYRPIYPIGDSLPLFGRAGLLRAVVNALREPQNLGYLLYGQRKIGKTSILRELFHRLPGIPIFSPVFFDFFDKTTLSLNDIVSRLALEIASQMRYPRPDLGNTPAVTFAESWLPGLVKSLPKGQILVLLLDEFGMLLDRSLSPATGQLIPYLRDLLQRNAPRLKVVFVTSPNIRDRSPGVRQLFQDLPASEVALLSEPETYELIRISETSGSLLWQHDALQEVWKLTAGHPFITQQLCAEVWLHIHENRSGSPLVVSRSEVQFCVARTLQASQISLEWIWRDLPSVVRLGISAWAEPSVKSLTISELARILTHYAASPIVHDLHELPQLLQEWDLLQPGKEPYQLRIELLWRWIEKHKTLNRAKEELSYLDPLTENLFQTAVRMYQSRKYEQARLLLRQAVEANPSHERAGLLLSEVFEVQGMFSDALHVLEPLYSINPFAIWPRLTRLHLIQARKETNPDIRLEIYQHILDVEPTHQEARLSSQAIWKNRAEKYASNGQLEAAYEAFINAGLNDQANKLKEQINRERLERGFQELKQFQVNRQFSQGLILAEKLSNEFADYPAWTQLIAEFRFHAELYDLYTRGLTALDLGDRKTAANLLSQVAVRNPSYEEVTRFLHQAVTGVDIVLLQRELEAIKQKLAHSRVDLDENVETSSIKSEPKKSQERVGAAPLFQVEPPFPHQTADRQKPHVETIARYPSLSSDPVTKLRWNFRQIQNGRFRLVGLTGETSPRLINLVPKLAAEEGLTSIIGQAPRGSEHPNYAVWRKIMQKLLNIKRELPVELQARQLREQLAALDVSYLSFFSKFSLVVLDVPVAGQTVLKLMTPQEIQAKIAEIVYRLLVESAAKHPFVLVMPDLHHLDSMSLQLLKRIVALANQCSFGILLTYAAGRNDPELQRTPEFVEIGEPK